MSLETEFHLSIGLRHPNFIYISYHLLLYISALFVFKKSLDQGESQL